MTPVSAPVASGLRIVGAPAPAAAPAPADVEEQSSALDDPDDQGDSAANDMRNLPLGTLLYRHGLVSQEELEEALTTGMATGERLGEILISRGRVSEDDIARLLAVQHGLPFLHEDEVPFDHEAAGMLPLDEARAMMALPVAYENGSVVVATSSPSVGQPDQLLQRLHRNVNAVVVTDSVFARLVERASGGGDLQVEEAPPAGESAPVDLSFLHGDEPGSQDEPADEAEQESSTPEAFAPAAAEAHDEVVADLAELSAADELEAEASSEPLGDAWYDRTEEPAQAEAEAAELELLSEPEPVADDALAWYESVEQAEPVEHADPVEQAEPVEHVEPLEQAEPVEQAVGDDPGSHDEVVLPAAVDDGRIGELGAQHEASVGRIQDLLGQIEAGASTFSDLRRRLGELGESLRVTEESLAEREQRLAELTHAHEDDQRRIEELVAQLRQRDDTLGELGGRVEELSGRLVSAEERLDEREQRLAQLDASLNESASRVEALFRQVELRDEALAGFADKLDALARQFGDQ